MPDFFRLILDQSDCGLVRAWFQVVVRRDPNGKSPELRHFIAWVLAGGATAMLLNSLILFNLAVFQGAVIGYWPAVLMFVGAALCSGNLARYAESPPPK